jgi:hypothetical protein
MIQYGILDIENIYSMLSPDDETIQKEAEQEFKDAKDFVRSMNILSTKEKSDDMEVDQNGITVIQ